MAAGRRFRTCPIGQEPLPGQGVTGAREGPYVWQDKCRCPFGRKVFDEMTDDHPDRDEENLIETDALLVEEVSIDGMCGVY